MSNYPMFHVDFPSRYRGKFKSSKKQRGIIASKQHHHHHKHTYYACVWSLWEYRHNNYAYESRQAQPHRTRRGQFACAGETFQVCDLVVWCQHTWPEKETLSWNIQIILPLISEMHSILAFFFLLLWAVSSVPFFYFCHSYPCSCTFGARLSGERPEGWTFFLTSPRVDRSCCTASFLLSQLTFPGRTQCFWQYHDVIAYVNINGLRYQTTRTMGQRQHLLHAHLQRNNPKLQVSLW